MDHFISVTSWISQPQNSKQAIFYQRTRASLISKLTIFGPSSAKILLQTILKCNVLEGKDGNRHSILIGICLDAASIELIQELKVI